jgi:hypothetical protein
VGLGGHWRRGGGGACDDGSGDASQAVQTASWAAEPAEVDGPGGAWGGFALSLRASPASGDGAGAAAGAQRSWSVPPGPPYAEAPVSAGGGVGRRKRGRGCDGCATASDGPRRRRPAAPALRTGVLDVCQGSVLDLDGWGGGAAWGRGGCGDGLVDV